jgi:hypothetical protein
MQVMVPGLGYSPDVDLRNIDIDVDIPTIPQQEETVPAVPNLPPADLLPQAREGSAIAPAPPPAPMLTAVEIERRYRRDPQFRINWLNLLDHVRTTQPLRFIKQMGIIDKRVKQDVPYRRFVRRDLLEAWKTHPELAKDMYGWLPHLYQGRKGARHLARYREYKGYRRWWRSQLLQMAHMNPPAFDMHMAAMKHSIDADPTYRRWVQRDIKMMIKHHYGDLAQLMSQAFPDLYDQYDAVSDAPGLAPGEDAVMDAVLSDDSTCVNCGSTDDLAIPEDEEEGLDIEEELEEEMKEKAPLMLAAIAIPAVIVGGILLVALMPRK